MNIAPLVILFFWCIVGYTLLVNLISWRFQKKNPTKFDYSYTPTVSVILSAYNEGEAAYQTIKSIMGSNYPADLIQVVAFDDCSKDDTWTWLEKALQEFPNNVIIQKNAANKGKADTLGDAAAVATHDILISTDGDTVFEKNAIREIVAGFADPTVGSVGGVIGIYNTNASLLCQMQAILYTIDFYFFKPLENITGTIQCLGGPLVGFRRPLYNDIVPEMIVKTKFLGKRITVGEDRIITQQVLLKGYKTIVNHKAKCWVGTPVTWSNYLKQQLRWRRSSIGQYWFTIVKLRKYIMQAGVVATIGSVMPVTVFFVFVLLSLYLLMCGKLFAYLLFIAMMKIVLMPLIALVYNHVISKTDPVQKLNNPILAGALSAIWFILCVILVAPWAAATLDEGGWVTRQNGSQGNV